MHKVADVTGWSCTSIVVKWLDGSDLPLGIVVALGQCHLLLDGVENHHRGDFGSKPHHFGITDPLANACRLITLLLCCGLVNAVALHRFGKVRLALLIVTVSK